MESIVVFSDKGLKNLDALFGSRRYVKVGVLAGQKNQRDDNTQNNATIGAVHEFGSITKKIPKRSFIRNPLTGMSNREEVFEKAVSGFNYGMESGNFVSFWDALGSSLVEKILDAFDQSGPGWAPLSESTIAARKRRHSRKGGGEKPLIDTGQLRRSISYKVISE